jgi:hypothetical protein
MQRLTSAGLVAVALFVLWNEDARAGSVHVTKAEDQAARIRLYEHEVTLRDEDPTAFDHRYPTLGKVLASEQGFDAFLAERTFPRLLCVHTPFLWRVVDGDILYHRIHPWPTPPLVSDGGPPLTPGNLPSSDPPGSGGPGGNGPGDPGNPGGGTVQVNSVPEPSSWVIMGSGVTVALLAAARRRIYKSLASASGRV